MTCRKSSPANKSVPSCTSAQITLFLFNSSHTLQGELNFWYATREKHILETQEPKYNLDLGFRVLLFDKTLQIALTARDIFKARTPYATLYSNGVRQYARYYNDSRQLNLSVKFQIADKEVKVKQRDFGNKEERQRT